MTKQTEQPAGLTAIQAGRLLSDVEHLSKTLDEHSKLLKKIDDKLDDRVTRDEFERYKNDHKQDVSKNYVTRDELRALLNFWKLVTGNVAKAFAIVLVGVAIYATNQLISQAQFINQLKADINNQRPQGGI